MTRKSTDFEIDELVKARWHAIGLSQADLAEVLEAASEPAPKSGGGAARISAGRLIQVAAALGVPSTQLDGRKEMCGMAPAPAHDADMMQYLLELRLLRVFRSLQGPQTKRMLIQLAEQIVKRQVEPGNAG